MRQIGIQPAWVNLINLSSVSSARQKFSVGVENERVDNVILGSPNLPGASIGSNAIDLTAGGEVRSDQGGSGSDRLRRGLRTGYYDLNGYYSAWFLTGQQPAITHDVLYWFYRREPTNAASPAQSLPIRITNSTATNDIELVAFLTAPGTLKITIGQKDYVQDANAGITSFRVPLQPGVPTFSLMRKGSNVFSFKGGVQIYGASGIPSGVLDLTYWSGSAAQSGRCAL